MTELHKLIKKGESETVEFKKSISEMKEAVIDICGFSNSKGGILIFGISNKGEIIGQEASDSTLRKISNTIVDNTDPKIYPSIEKVAIKDEEVVLITIDSSPYKPHTAYGKPYKRVGTTTKQMSQAEYHYLLNKRDAFHYDRQILENAKLKDIDTKKLKWFLRTAKYERNLDISLTLSVEVWNPGRLPEGMTVEMLKKKHESKPFNPLIARMFFLIKYIEQWGMGTNNIVKWCRENGNPDPKFEYTGTSLVVTFKKVKITGRKQEVKEFFDLNERQKKALKYIETKGKITNKEYQKICKIDRVTAFRDLQDLVKKQVTEKVGVTGKWTYYKMKR